MTKKTYTNPNERGKYTIEYATQFSRGDRIDVPMRLVVIQYMEAQHALPFAVRWQNKSGATFGGASYGTKHDAHTAFLRKYLNHNDCYKEGNPSHLPGMNNRV